MQTLPASPGDVSLAAQVRANNHIEAQDAQRDYSYRQEKHATSADEEIAELETEKRSLSSSLSIARSKIDEYKIGVHTAHSLIERAVMQYRDVQTGHNKGDGLMLLLCSILATMRPLDRSMGVEGLTQDQADIAGQDIEKTINERGYP